MKKTVSFPVTDFDSFKIKMLNWANRFSIFVLLDNQHYDFNKPAFECLLAAGSKASLEMQSGEAMNKLRAFYHSHKHEWLFGHIGYDLKNELEGLQSQNPDGIGFSDLHFFIPETIIELEQHSVKIHSDADAAAILESVLLCPGVLEQQTGFQVLVQQKLSKTSYTETVEKLRQHILRGDCYEINFCHEFFAKDTYIDPLYTYGRLTAQSPNPFSVLYKLHHLYCLCASPERYLKKEGSKIMSQPIKGTSKREPANKDADESARQYLLQSEKEKSENVMVVDLVRNDLSRICKPGTVKVDELFGIYSFPQVHQMISTISGELETAKDWIDCIAATFPMGSMTGAPKRKVLELIEQYEQSRRGLFSGTIGYVKPGGDFDFNVVIRSIFYNSTAKYLSFQAGGGITYNSCPEKEYEESLLKVKAMMKVLEQD